MRQLHDHERARRCDGPLRFLERQGLIRWGAAAAHAAAGQGRPSARSLRRHSSREPSVAIAACRYELNGQRGVCMARPVSGWRSPRSRPAESCQADPRKRHCARSGPPQGSRRTNDARTPEPKLWKHPPTFIPAVCESKYRARCRQGPSTARTGGPPDQQDWPCISKPRLRAQGTEEGPREPCACRPARREQHFTIATRFGFLVNARRVDEREGARESPPD